MFRVRKLAPEFQRIFGMSIGRFMDIFTGFDIVMFDDILGVPDGVSCQEFVQTNYGKRGVELIKKLISL